MGEFSPWHLLIVAGVFILLFGAKRLPDAARSIGRSTRILKSELSGLRSEDPPATETPVTTAAPVAAAAPVAEQPKASQTATG